MKTYPRLMILSVASLLLIGFGLGGHLLLVSTASSAGQNKDAPVSVRSAGRGNPHVNFADGKELAAGDGNAQNGGSQPTTLAAADFDSDGVPDLVVADRNGGLKLYRGNMNHLYPNSPQAEAQQAGRSFDSEPLNLTGKTASVSTAPDFLFAGDFNADGHQDILAATRGETFFSLLPGDGAGNFAAEAQIQIDGTITALKTGEIGRADGQTDLAIAVTNKKGAWLFVYEHPEGAFKYRPESFKLAAPATELAVGEFDKDSFGDVVAASGNDLTVIHGRGQAYPWDMLKDYGIKRPAAIVEIRQMPFQIAALAVGKFTEGRGDSLAILTSNGSLQILESAPNKAPKNTLSSKARIRLKGPAFTPGGVGANKFAAFDEKAPTDSKIAEQPGLPLIDSSLKGEKLREYLREKSKRAEEEFAKLDVKEQARLTGENLSRAKGRREASKAGYLKTISAKPAAPLARWNLQTLLTDSRLISAANSPNAQKLIRVRVSDSSKDELVLLDTSAKQIHLLSVPPAVAGGSTARQNPPAAAGSSEIVSFAVETSPTAVLPLRLNSDALSDLVVSREGSPNLTVVPSAPANTFVVNTADDSSGGNCDGVEPCSLRQAINLANGSPGADAITFDIAGGVQTITLLSELPDITGAVTIDGTTQPGFSGSPLIEIKGVNLPAGKDGLRINGSDIVVRGLAINEFPTQSDPNSFTLTGGNGIAIFSVLGGPRNGNNIIEGNYLGTDPTGGLDKGNGATGLNIFDSDNNLIGGTTAQARNVISGNSVQAELFGLNFDLGVGLSITAGNNNQIKGNFIGTDASGVLRIPNIEGVFFTGKNNAFGGDEAGAGNVVSGNGGPPNGNNQCFGKGVSVELLFTLDTGELLTLDNNFKGNKIGTTFNGAAPLGNCSQGITFNPATRTSLGSITENGRNTVSGNGYNAVWCNDGPGIGLPGSCQIAGNNIGTDITGTTAIPNDLRNEPLGTELLSGAVRISLTEDQLGFVGAPGGTTPGGACTGFCNLISGNGGFGAISRDSGFGQGGSGQAFITNNYIGTNRNGTAALPNTTFGMVLFFGDVSIGAVHTDSNGNQTSGGNLISGNDGGGVYVISDSGDLDIVGNLIGTSADGVNAIPNTGDSDSGGGFGIRLDSLFSQISVGGTNPLQRNVIGGNTGDGVTLSTLSTVTIFNNYIGVNVSGAPLGNGKNGVAVFGSGSCGGEPSVQVGGRGASQGNVIKNNGGAGVFIFEDSSATTCGSVPITNDDVPITGNSIAGNGGLGIDLTTTSGNFTREGDGVTPNDCLDADEGANRLQNFPVLTAPVFNPDGTVTVGGGFQSTPLSSFTLDFYSNTAADPSLYGEGETHIGSKTVQTDSSGITTFEFTSTVQVASSLKITATATDTDGNTSEFSCAAGECTGGTGGSPQEIEALLAPTCLTPIIVNINTDEPDENPGEGICDVDSNTTGSQCSLRAAIETANAHSGFDLINFDIPGGGVQTIAPTSALPDITERVFIDATTQPGYATAPLIELNGANAGDSYGLIFRSGSDSSGVFALTVNRFSEAGILFESNENRLEKSYIGMFADGSGFDPSGRQLTGVLIFGSENIIGGTTATARNVLSGNSQHQVKISSSSAKKNVVATNFIGVAIDGQTIIRYPLQRGVELIDGASDNRIGGTSIEEVNVIAGHEIGVHITNNSKRNGVLHNQISDCETGVKIADASDNTIGGARGNTADSSSSRNQIVDNVVGIFIGGTGAASQTKGNKVQGNWIGLLGDETLDRSNEFGIRIAAAEGTLIGTGDIEFHNVVSGNTDTGIVLEKDAVRNLIHGNFIGTDTAGVVPKPNRYGVRMAGSENELRNNVISGNTEYGVVVDTLVEGDPVPLKNVINNNRIGTKASGDVAIPNRESGILLDSKETTVTSNIISGNIKYGIEVRSDENNIANNKIGTNAAGAGAVGNGEAGIIISSSTNTITSNTISGNQAGIVIIPFAATPTTYPAFNVIQKNRVGTNSNGTAAVPNTKVGIGLSNGPNNNLIGGAQPDLGNVISGNGIEGIVIQRGTDAGAIAPFENRVQGNFIGTDETGNNAIPNLQSGILLSGAVTTLIGGFGNDIPAARNIISANGLVGVSLSGASSQNRISGNYIGTKADGASPLGNARAGVFVGTGSVNNIIGGTEPNSGNVIAFNGNHGVALGAGAGSGNLIDPNSIFGNAGLGIDVGDDGLTPNDTGDADTGPNQLQNYPEFTSAVIIGGNLVVQYKVDSAPGNSNYGADGLYIEFFKADAGLEGQTFIGSTHYTATNYNNGTPGTATFNAGAAAGLGVSVGDKIVATASDADGNTSEFTGTNVGTVSSPTAATAIIEGQIVTTDGAPLAGVTIALSGTQNRRTITDDNGHYRFTEVETTGFYSVAPSRANFTFTPANRSFSALGNTTEAAFTAVADATQTANPLDSPEYFVRQHYLDFLGREPDESGFNFWSDQILECGADAGCAERRRINVSAAYFLSIEFQQTGGLIDGLYRASFGVRPQFAEFMPDTRAVAQDVVVGRQGWQAKLEANKQAFVAAFVQRPAFINAYGNMSNNLFVDTLISHTGVSFSSGEHDALVSGLANGTLTRAAALRSIAENNRFVNAKFNETFVMMEYFGYLRRDPDESGYQFWLAKLNQFNGNFEQAEMVRAFIVSGEYRARFPH